MNIYNLTDVPTLQQQASTAMGIEEPTPPRWTPPAEPQPEQPDIDELLKDNSYKTALQAILATSKPQPDPEKEKRYKQRAAFNSLGQGLKQVFSGVQMNNGLLVQPEKQNEEPTNALAKYYDDMKQKQEAYDKLSMQGQLEGLRWDNEMKKWVATVKENRALKAEDAKVRKGEFDAEMKHKDDVLKQNQSQFESQLEADETKTADTLAQRERESIRENQTRNNAISAGVAEDKAKAEARNYIYFKNSHTGQDDRISREGAEAIALAKVKELEKGKSQMEIAMMNQMGGEYSQLKKLLQGGLTDKEASILMRDNYTLQSAAATKAFSEGDMKQAYQRVYGNSQTSNPSQGTNKYQQYIRK